MHKLDHVADSATHGLPVHVHMNKKDDMAPAVAVNISYANNATKLSHLDGVNINSRHLHVTGICTAQRHYKYTLCCARDRRCGM